MLYAPWSSSIERVSWNAGSLVSNSDSVAAKREHAGVGIVAMGTGVVSPPARRCWM